MADYEPVMVAETFSDHPEGWGGGISGKYIFFIDHNSVAPGSIRHHWTLYEVVLYWLRSSVAVPDSQQVLSGPFSTDLTLLRYIFNELVQLVSLDIVGQPDRIIISV
jgi:hypothetical protein